MNLRFLAYQLAVTKQNICESFRLSSWGGYERTTSNKNIYNQFFLLRIQYNFCSYIFFV